MVMRRLLYVVALLLAASWLLGVFYWNTGGMVHLLLLLAVVAFLFGIIQKA